MAADAAGAQSEGEYKLFATYEGHKKAISSVSFSPDGTRLASACATFLLPLALSYPINNL